MYGEGWDTVGQGRGVGCTCWSRTLKHSKLRTYTSLEFECYCYGKFGTTSA
jgi:hypothetical protein